MKLSPIECRIYTLVRRAGPDGVGGHDLFSMVYDEMSAYAPWAHLSRQRNTLKAHVYQINQKLKGERIVGSKCAGGWYTLKQLARPLPKSASAPDLSRSVLLP